MLDSRTLIVICMLITIMAAVLVPAGVMAVVIGATEVTIGVMEAMEVMAAHIMATMIIM